MIEIIPHCKEEKNYFIKILKEENEIYYHIYFNSDVKEIKRTYFNQDDNITKIKIIIDEEIKSLEYLFIDCIWIEKITFIKFNRKNINNMRNKFAHWHH